MALPSHGAFVIFLLHPWCLPGCRLSGGGLSGKGTVSLINDCSLVAPTDTLIAYLKWVLPCLQVVRILNWTSSLIPSPRTVFYQYIVPSPVSGILYQVGGPGGLGTGLLGERGHWRGPGQDRLGLDGYFFMMTCMYEELGVTVVCEVSFAC